MSKNTAQANSNSLKLSHLKQAVIVCLKAKLPCFIYGPPGVGKSDLVHQIASELFDGNLIDVRLSQFDPVDLRGIPSVKDGVTIWNRPAFLPTEGSGLLFLDEYGDAQPDVQNVCKQLLLDRRIGDYHLPEGWHVIAATNRTEDKAGVSSGKNTANNNRVAHFDVSLDIDDWTTWAADHDIRPEVLAFCRFRSDLLHDFDPKRAEPAFPSPRSWSFVSRLIESTIPSHLEHPLLSGVIGSGAASEFVGFLRIWRNLPNLDAILLAPDTTPVPDKEDLATRYAVAVGLAGKVSAKSYGNAIKYLDRLSAPEYGVLCSNIAIKKDPAICTTKDFASWAAKNGKYYA